VYERNCKSGIEDPRRRQGVVMSREDVIGMVVLLLAVIVACTQLESQ
jgi:hypothetical protein